MANANSSMKLWHALLLAREMALLSVIATLETAGISLHSKVAVNETRIEAHDAQFDHLGERLKSIEDKLDRLIERK